MTMDTSFHLLLLFAGAFGLAAADHYLLGGGLSHALDLVGDAILSR
jgi:hypothetical protein